MNDNFIPYSDAANRLFFYWCQVWPWVVLTKLPEPPANSQGIRLRLVEPIKRVVIFGNYTVKSSHFDLEIDFLLRD